MLNNVELNLNNIDKSILEILDNFNKATLKIHSKDNLINCKNILIDVDNVENKLLEYLKNIKNIKININKFIDEIESDLSKKRKNENFIFNTVYGMLSYPGRDYLVQNDKLDKPNKSNKQDKQVNLVQNDKLDKLDKLKLDKPNKQDKVDQDKQKYKMENVLICDGQKKVQTNNMSNILNLFKLPYVNNLHNIPSIFYIFNKSKSTMNYKEDIYCCIVDNVFAQVPFPTIIDSTKELNRDYTIKCKHKLKNICDEYRNKMSSIYNNTIRKCNFAHEGDNIIKIGYPSRCSLIPDVGNLNFLDRDLSNIDIDSVKNLLLYGLHDVFIAMLWLKKNNIKSHTFCNLHIA
jgi:hypothetical protein